MEQRFRWKSIFEGCNLTKSMAWLCRATSLTAKRAEERLREFGRVVESLDEMSVVVDRDHRYVLANRAFLHHRGMTKEQIVGRHLTEILHPDSYETTVKEKLDEAFRGKVVNYEMKCDYPGIGERDLAITYLPVEGPAGIDRVDWKSAVE